MSGQGAKKFPAFSKLSSNDVNGYLSSQVIMRFATTTARDAAFGGTGEFTLAEGMTCYVDADNTIYTYDGSNWVKMVSASQPNGLVLVKSVAIPTSPTTSIDVTSCFSSEFDDYKVFIEHNGNGTAVFLGVTLLNGTTPTSGVGYYGNTQSMTSNSSTIIGNGYANSASFQIGAQQGGTDRVYHEFEIRGPFKTFMTQQIGRATTYLGGFGYNYTFSGMHNLNSSYDGFRVSVGSGSFNTGSIRVYGYRQ